MATMPHNRELKGDSTDQVKSVPATLHYRWVLDNRARGPDSSG